MQCSAPSQHWPSTSSKPPASLCPCRRQTLQLQPSWTMRSTQSSCLTTRGSEWLGLARMGAYGSYHCPCPCLASCCKPLRGCLSAVADIGRVTGFYSRDLPLRSIALLMACLDLDLQSCWLLYPSVATPAAATNGIKTLFNCCRWVILFFWPKDFTFVW